MTMNGWPSNSSMPWMVQMLGWFNAEAVRASRLKRSNTRGSWENPGGRNFRATCRPSLLSSAL
mgnify:CR=1 FL=1